MTERTPKAGEQADQIAPRDAELAEAGRDGGDSVAQLAPADLAELCALRGVLDRERSGILAAKKVLGVVQLRPLEPPRAGHRALGEDGRVGGRRADLEVLPDRGPE